MHNRRHTSLAVALALFVAGCDTPPTGPRADARRPRLAAASATAILAQDLGVLPGDVRSEATYVTENGTVYGRSFASNSEDSPARFFRWTSSGGMVQVGSIPQLPAPALPASLPVPAPPPTWERTIPLAANAKGEVTGLLCFTGCEEPFDPTSPGTAHAFRYSAGAGVRDIDGRFGDFGEPFGLEPLWMSRGWSINRWGHVAGAYSDSDNDPVVFFWTPLPGPVEEFGQFVLVGGAMSVDFADMQVNDVDQVIGRVGGQVSDPCAFVWRPDLGRRELLSPGVECQNDSGSPGRALAQQIEGTLVVGWARFPDGLHAAVWRVPALSREAFPKVDANPYGGRDGLTYLSKGGWYFQLYRATQASPAGPYLELVDWGDGTTSRRTRARIGAITSQNHVYARAGTYWVRVYVQDAQGRWGVAERKVTVKP